MTSETFFRRLNRKGFNWTPLYVLLSLLIQGTIVIMLLVQGTQLMALNAKPAPTLVELADGTGIRVGAIDSRDRSPDAIVKFTRETMKTLFSWTGKVLDEKNRWVPDPGVEIPGAGTKVTTPVWAASFAIRDESFRRSLLTEIARQTPPSVFSGTGGVVLDIKHITEPEKIKDGQWQVQMIANLLTISTADRVGTGIAFNKKIVVSAIDPPASLLPETPTEKVVFNLKKNGLAIDFIQELI